MYNNSSISSPVLSIQILDNSGEEEEKEEKEKEEGKEEKKLDNPTDATSVLMRLYRFCHINNNSSLGSPVLSIQVLTHSEEEEGGNRKKRQRMRRRKRRRRRRV